VSGPRPARVWARRLLWALVLLLPLLLAGGIVKLLGEEGRVLAAATSELRSGRTEAALDSLDRLWGRRLLSAAARRRAAELYLRLGEDRKAHTFLAGQRPEKDHPADRRLQELSARCQQASHLLARADRSRSPRERVRLLREARLLLPDSPGVLQRLVQEELLLFTRSSDPEDEARFSEAYTELARAAPRRAAEVKRRAQEMLRAGEATGSQ